MNYILFSLGALTMIIEFAIPRLIAPAYGNTLFSWTAIITVVLVSMTVGYYFGGKPFVAFTCSALLLRFGPY